MLCMLISSVVLLKMCCVTFRFCLVLLVIADKHPMRFRLQLDIILLLDPNRSGMEEKPCTPLFSS
jgi:hypothetical protein